jgi:hypothetical protein
VIEIRRSGLKRREAHLAELGFRRGSPARACRGWTAATFWWVSEEVKSRTAFYTTRGTQWWPRRNRWRPWSTWRCGRRCGRVGWWPGAQFAAKQSKGKMSEGAPERGEGDRREEKGRHSPSVSDLTGDTRRYCRLQRQILSVWEGISKREKEGGGGASRRNPSLLVIPVYRRSWLGERARVFGRGRDRRWRRSRARAGYLLEEEGDPDMRGPGVSGRESRLGNDSSGVRCWAEAESGAGPIWSPEAFSSFLYFFSFSLFWILVLFINFAYFTQINSNKFLNSANIQH